jgi:glutathione S-transferase
MIKLHHSPTSTCSQKVQFVLEEKSVPWESMVVNLKGGENFLPEFLKLNPKGVVPVLVDNGEMILESNNICLYLDDKYPQVPLMPDTPKRRSDVRTLLQWIDEHIHHDISACTYPIAFRPDVIKIYDTPEKLEIYISKVPDAGKRQFRREMMTKGTECAAFKTGVTRLASVLERLEALLQKSSYLVSNQLTVADIAYSPYMTRLDHLSMSFMWDDKPAVRDWYERLKSTAGYEKGMRTFFVPAVIEKMGAGGKAARPSIEAVLAAD